MDAFKPENDDISYYQLNFTKSLKKEYPTLISDEYYKNKIIVTKEFLIKNSILL